MPLIEPRFRSLFGLLFSVFVFFGTSMTIIGATLPKILQDFHWDYVTAGAVIAAGAVAYFLGTFSAGYLVKHLGPKGTILLGLILDTIGLLFFGAYPSPIWNFGFSFLIGIGQGFFEVSVNWSALQIDYKETGKPMNVLHGAFAVGAIVGPLILGVLIGNGVDWTVLYRSIAVVFALIAVLLIFAPFNAIHKTVEEKPAAPQVKFLLQPAAWLAFLGLFLYVGVELGFSNWVAEYFNKNFGFDPAWSSLMVSLFWGGVLVGRFGVPVFYKGEQQGGVVNVFSAVATAAVLLLSLAGFVGSSNGFAPILATGLVFLAGLGCSIIYPVVITLVGACFPDVQGRAVGLAATGGGIGSFVFPFVMSALAQNWGLNLGFAAYGAFAVLMTIVIALLASYASRRRKT